MPHTIVDRRFSGKDKNVDNRHRFIQKVKHELKGVIKDNVINGKVEDIIEKKTYDVAVKKSAIFEPKLIFERGSGNVKSVHAGNNRFIRGETIPKPPSGEDGDGSSDEVGGEDQFRFVLTQDEFINLFFEDLQLPRLFKKKLLGSATQVYYRRGGIARDGIPPRLNYLRTLRQSIGRRSALKTPLQKELEQKQAELAELLAANSPENSDRIEALKKDIADLEKKIHSIPFLDYVDLRYNRLVKVEKPSVKAVMFCVMDVSGSMGEDEKEIAKRFFMLLYIFLRRIYKSVDLVFIRYHGEAREVDEKEFFYGQDTGGTVFSHALRLIENKIEKHYNPDDWNIYCCHATDGDNFAPDNDQCLALLEKLVPLMQYYAYVQVSGSSIAAYLNTVGPPNKLWRIMSELNAKFNNVGSVIISNIREIWPVFSKLFEKSETKDDSI